MVQSVQYFTGFETGDASEVSAVGAGNSVQSSTVRTGGYALKAAGASAGCSLTTTLSATQLVYRGYIQLSGVPAQTRDCFRELVGSTPRLRLELLTTRKLTALDGGTGTLGLTGVNGTTVLNTGQWYRIEVVLDLAAGGVVQVYIDGVIEINTTHTSDVTAAPTTTVNVYGDSTNGVFYDDIRIDTGGLNLIGAGHCAMRQGVAGTPTYDAWTKTGTTTSALAWSETPFSATKNCNDTSLSAKQTMLVALFSTGTPAISSGATINACKIALVGKSSVTAGGAGNFDILRRVGGADTVTAATFTTADKYFQTEIFTDTTANLDAYEVGAQHLSVAATHTVEDVWMMVDYTPVANSFVIGVASFTLAGQALTLPVGRVIALGAAAFTLTGEPLTRTLAIHLGAASFTLTGMAMTAPVGRKIMLGTAAFLVNAVPGSGKTELILKRTFHHTAAVPIDAPTLDRVRVGKPSLFVVRV